MWTFDATLLSFCSQARCSIYEDVEDSSDTDDDEEVEDSSDNDDNDASDLTAPVTMVCLSFMLPNVH